jgi:hypothetical protein
METTKPQPPTQPTQQEEPIPNDPHDEQEVLNTLEEPVYQTILRELSSIGRKTSLVLIPRHSNIVELRDWDLWGPLFFILVLALSLGVSATGEGESGFVFSGVFVLVTIGSIIVTINCQLLGGTLSFFQSICILGYCIFPLDLCSLIFVFVKNYIARAILVTFGCIWSCVASIVFITGNVKEH